MIKQLSPRERALGIAVAGLVMMFGVYRFVWQPLTRVASGMNQQISVSQAKLMKSIRITHHAAQINQEYEKLSSIHQFKGTNEEMLSTLLRSLESSARNCAITITDIKPRAGQDAPNHRQYTIEMDIEVTPGCASGLMLFYSPEHAAGILLDDEGIGVRLDGVLSVF